MADIPQPADLADVLADYERRLRALETAPRLNNSAFPWVLAYVDAIESTTSLTNTDLTTPGPSVTVTVGQTGRVLVFASAYINNASTFSGYVSLFMDGSLLVDLLSLGTSAGAANANPGTMRSYVVGAGTHTFTLKYRTSGGTTAFAGRFLMIQPY